MLQNHLQQHICIAIIECTTYSKQMSHTLVMSHALVMSHTRQFCKARKRLRPAFSDIKTRKTDMLVKFLLSCSTLTIQHPILPLSGIPWNSLVAESLDFSLTATANRQEESNGFEKHFDNWCPSGFLCRLRGG